MFEDLLQLETNIMPLWKEFERGEEFAASLR